VEKINPLIATAMEILTIIEDWSTEYPIKVENSEILVDKVVRSM